MKIDFMKDCKKVRLGDIFIKLTRKNTENNTNVLTISAKYGLVNQEEFFSKSVASDNKSNYFLLYKGDFAYNKSYSNGYPFGAIKVLQRYEKGIVSPLYICFSPAPENYCPEFYLHYFESGLMNKAIRAIAQEGARNHGLLNIGIDDFFNISIPLPSLEIQQKIAKILSTQDKFIELKQKLIDRKKQQKKWLMQKIFSQELRFKRRDGADFPQWEEKKLIDIGKAIGGSGFNEKYQGYIDLDIPFYKISDMNTFGNERIMKFSNNYVSNELLKKMKLKAFYKNSIIFAKVGAALLLDRKRIVYPPFLVDNNMMIFTPKDDSIFLLWLYYWFMNIKLAKLSQVGALPSINAKDIEELKIKIPCLEEQQKIAKILSAQDKEIELLEKELEQEKLKKKALMQLLLTVK